MGVVDIIVISIALVSIFVAGLGIMNSLYTSVRQRTKEIGTMKAVGATNSQILFIFILESAILGFFGGIIGITIGISLAYALIGILNTFGFVKIVLEVSPSLIIFTILFSVILGILSGLLPAIKASKLNPVDALRYE